MPSKQSVGLAYELLCVNVLNKNGFSVDHCGRKGDKGMDFKGHWTVSGAIKQTISIVGQCKHHKAKSSPVHIREVEGTLHRIRNSFCQKDTAGLLVTSSGFTSGTIVYCQASSLPLLMCQIRPVINSSSSVETLAIGYISRVIFSKPLKRLFNAFTPYQYRINDQGIREVVFL